MAQEIIPLKIPGKPGRPRKIIPQTPLDHLIVDLRRFIDENGSDRVSASRTLYDVLLARGDLTDPLIPNDTSAVIIALGRQLEAAGRDLAQRAWDSAFPPKPLSEAPLAPETSPGPPPR